MSDCIVILPLSNLLIPSDANASDPPFAKLGNALNFDPYFVYILYSHKWII